MSEMKEIEMNEDFSTSAFASTCEKGFYYEKFSHDSLNNNLVYMREGRLA